jgi:hypothetical protein
MGHIAVGLRPKGIGYLVLPYFFASQGNESFEHGERPLLGLPGELERIIIF